MFLGASIFGIVLDHLYFITGNTSGLISFHSISDATQVLGMLRIDVPTDVLFIMYVLAAFANAIILFIILALFIVVHRFKPSWLRKYEAT